MQVYEFHFFINDLFGVEGNIFIFSVSYQLIGNAFIPNIGRWLKVKADN